jgi:hypothetical protein
MHKTGDSWYIHGARCSVVDQILPAALGPGVYQPLAEMSTRIRKIMSLGCRARSVCRADNLTAISEPII